MEVKQIFIVEHEGQPTQLYLTTDGRFYINWVYGGIGKPRPPSFFRISTQQAKEFLDKPLPIHL